MYYYFSTFGIIILSVFSILCLAFLYYLRKRIRTRITAESDLTNKKYGVLWIIFGLLISLISVIFHIYIQVDYYQSSNLLRPITEMVTEPIFLLTIIFFLIGLTTFLVGIYAVRFRKEILNKSL